MPKELARVMARYADIQDKAAPVLAELRIHERDYVLLTSYLSVAYDDLADRLKSLNVRDAADPRAAKDRLVIGCLENCEKYELLVKARHKAYSATAKKADTICAEIVKLEKDVAVVIKAKSGFFSTSKSLPKLKALSTKLHEFAVDLDTASAGP
jgi:hypothetical protein